MTRSGALREKMGDEQKKEQREQEVNAYAKLFETTVRGKRNRIDDLECRRRKKPKTTVMIWILGKISLVGTEFGGRDPGSSFLVMSSTIDLPLPLFDHVLFQVQKSLWLVGEEKVAQLDKVPSASET